MRNGSTKICDIVLQDPNFSSQVLHSENNSGETPYQLDVHNKKTILNMTSREGR